MKSKSIRIYLFDLNSEFSIKIDQILINYILYLNGILNQLQLNRK